MQGLVERKRSQFVKIVDEIQGAFAKHDTKESIALAAQKLWELTLFDRNHRFLPLSLVDTFKKTLETPYSSDITLKPLLLNTAWGILNVPMLRSKFLSLDLLNSILKLFNSENIPLYSKPKERARSVHRRKSTFMSIMSPTGARDTLWIFSLSCIFLFVIFPHHQFNTSRILHHWSSFCRRI
jgi:hypothetical protein